MPKDTGPSRTMLIEELDRMTRSSISSLRETILVKQKRIREEACALLGLDKLSAELERITGEPLRLSNHYLDESSPYAKWVNEQTTKQIKPFREAESKINELQESIRHDIIVSGASEDMIRALTAFESGIQVILANLPK